MKILFHITCFLLVTAMRCQAATAAYVVVPVPKLSMEEALAKAKPRFGTHKRFRIVSIDWANAADFQPRVFDGTVYSPAGHSVEVIPEIKEGHLTYNAHVTMRDLAGIKNEDGQKLSETTSHELYLSGTPTDGEWVWFDMSDTTSGQKKMVCLRFTRKKA